MGHRARHVASAAKSQTEFLVPPISAPRRNPPTLGSRFAKVDRCKSVAPIREHCIASFDFNHPFQDIADGNSLSSWAEICITRGKLVVN